MRLILASESRSRRQMLSAAGLAYEAVASGVDEAAEHAALLASGRAAGPGDVALHLARAKAAAVGKSYPDAVVVGSDQVLALGEEILSKAGSRDAARAALLKLRGRRHELHSALAVVHRGREIRAEVDVARLDVRAFSDAFLERYLDEAGDALTACVGAYRLEGPGIQLFDRIDGAYHTILGMPLLPLLATLREMKVLSS